MPPYAYMYGLPYEYYDKYHIRRYGAHGTSHQFVAKKGAEMVGLDLNNSRIITCHIGNGSSITAIVNGKSIDTSMGLTPLEGLVMGTRCGDVDANAVLYMMKKENLTPDQMYDIAPTPSTSPSRRNSIAGAHTELANPVMGTMEPAPAYFPILSYTPTPVSVVPRNTSTDAENIGSC